MDRGIGFLGFFQILFGGGSLFYGFGTLGFYLLTNPAITPVETLPAVWKDFLNDPLLKFFSMPYLAPYFFLVGIVAIISGALILSMGYKLNGVTKLYSGVFSDEQEKWSNGIMNVFLVFAVLSGIVFLLHGIAIQLGGQ